MELSMGVFIIYTFIYLVQWTKPVTQISIFKLPKFNTLHQSPPTKNTPKNTQISIYVSCCLMILIKYKWFHLSLRDFSGSQPTQSQPKLSQNSNKSTLRTFNLSKEKPLITKEKVQTIKRSTQKAYNHPYDDQHHRPYYSVLHSIQTYIDLYGAEQVFPDYENLGMAKAYSDNKEQI